MLECIVLLLSFPDGALLADAVITLIVGFTDGSRIVAIYPMEFRDGIFYAFDTECLSGHSGGRHGLWTSQRSLMLSL